MRSIGWDKYSQPRTIFIFILYKVRIYGFLYAIPFKYILILRTFKYSKCS